MALEYRHEAELDRGAAELNKRNLLYKVGCVVQHYLDDPDCGTFLLCIRLGDPKLQQPEDIIHCSCHSQLTEIEQYVEDFEPPSAQRVFDYVYGSKQEFFEALAWPDNV
ncbi:MAG: hypothetical protein EHM61_05235 [Acidobacteria bacterium]|nr:MAG: hypothetical protein EHM61_05235 [Acidobacteriota bacterium]